MEDSVKAIVDFISEHGWLALPIMAAISFAESLAFLSLLFPGWGIMVAIGALAGSGVLSPWPVVIGAIIGAVLGDAVSYWIGRYFGHRIANAWPFRTHPEMLIRAHAFFEKYGGISIAIGRFSGPLRAVIPLVAGIAEMPSRPFWFWNVASAIVWSPTVVFSAALFGWTVERAATSGNGVLIAAAIVVLLAVGAWFALLKNRR